MGPIRYSIRPMDVLDSLRVVLVHDWLTGMRGGEKVLEVMCRRFPEARLHTLIHRPGSVSADIERLEPRTSWLQLLPRVDRYYRYLLPLMPRLARRWQFDDCDLVLSSSHCVAKAAKAPPGVPHVCYCHTPMRYAWHQRTAYFAGQDSKVRDWLLERLRLWDLRTANSVTHFIANGETVQRRIRECYGRESTVIHPPVDTEFYTPTYQQREDLYLVVSAFAPYKRVDLAIDACNRLNKRLVIIGQGQDEKKLRARAGATVSFLGWQPAEVIRDHYRRCKALLFPGEEDFGIVPVEAMACGSPVIALGRGGATETVVHGETGLWFAEPTVESLIHSIQQKDDLSPHACRANAERFNIRRFEQELTMYLREVLTEGGVRQAA